MASERCSIVWQRVYDGLVAQVVIAHPFLAIAPPRFEAQQTPMHHSKGSGWIICTALFYLSSAALQPHEVGGKVTAAPYGPMRDQFACQDMERSFGWTDAKFQY